MGILKAKPLTRVSQNLYIVPFFFKTCFIPRDVQKGEKKNKKKKILKKGK